jgi:hypothetical protein
MKRRPKKKYERKMEVIEKLVKHDLDNGRMVQKRIKGKLEDLGMTPESVAEELATKG